MELGRVVEGVAWVSWSLVKLEDIFNIARGGSPRPIADYITDAPDGINWISIKDASNSEKYITKTKLKIRKEGLKKSRLVKEGDFLLTNSMSFGRPYIMKTTGCIHDGWLVLSSDTKVVNQDYFYYLLGSPFLHSIFSKLAAGAVVKNLNIDLVKGVKIPLPSIEEQKKIAEILDAADSLRQKDQQLVEHYDRLSQSLFLDMFGDPVTNPKKWDVQSISAFSQVQGGLQVSAKRVSLPIEIDYLRVANVYRNKLHLSEIKTLNATAAEIKRVTLQKNDLLVVEGHGNKNEIGRVALWDGSIKSIIHQNHLIRVRVNTSIINPIYICHYLNSNGGRRGLISSSNTTSGLNTISTRIVKEAKCNIPPLKLQNEFSKRIKEIEKQKELAQQSLKKSDDLFNSLLQRAFKGELTHTQ